MTWRDFRNGYRTHPARGARRLLSRHPASPTRIKPLKIAAGSGTATTSKWPASNWIAE